ncbi:MAG: hypothetical protein JSV01_09055 [Desulfobacterales bacterium]|nr:MAG: hypothetical protein JSV01_09055 [Desulfobacterales bacterium]
MSIRMVAKELYDLQREVEELEAKLESAPPHEREEMEELLRKARAERDRMRKILDGEKVPPPFRKPI